MIRVYLRRKLTLVFVTILVLVFVAGCTVNEASVVDEKLQVAVTIVPQGTFVEKVAGDLVDVVTIIPPGSSPANYQPTPKEMIDLENSSVYFAIGVPTEAANVIPNMVADSDVKIVALHGLVSELYEDRYFGGEHEDDHDGHDHGEGSRDAHIWLSPKRVIVMVEAIRDELSELDPNNADTYADNAASFIEELETTDQEISEMFSDEEHLGFIITHPSMGYFADDYGLHMTSLEKDGKTATATWMQELIDFALEEDIHVVFYQAEFDSTQSDTLADAIDGEAMKIEPLSPDYINNLKAMAEAFLAH